MRILLKNGYIVDDKVFKGNVLVENGLIKAVTSENAEAEQIIDCTDKYIVPGLIDMHVHLREPGFEYKEDLKSGAESAIAGGVTTVCCMANTSPVIDNSGLAGWVRKRSNEIGLADIFPFGSVTKGMMGEELTDVGDLMDAGVCGISEDGKPVQSAEVMRRALEYSKHFGTFISCHEEDVELFNKGSVHEGAMSTEFGLRPAPAEAESIMISRDIELARLTGGRVHICHVSSMHSVEHIKRAKEDGIKVTAEVTPNHLALNEDICSSYDTNTKVNPPLRSEKDRHILIEALKNGVIDCVASDHAPHHIDNKLMEYDLAAYGMIGLQLTIPLMMRHIKDGTLSWVDFVRATAINPAKILKFNDRGRLMSGLKADITVIDPNMVYMFDDSVNKSKSQNTPFWGQEVFGMAVVVLKNGVVVK